MNEKKNELIELVTDLEVEFIHLQFTDIIGTMKNITILPDQLEKALDGEIMFDGSSIDGFVRIEESDMYLKPDLNTFCIFPWITPHIEARIICDVYTAEKEPFEGCPRTILKKSLRKALDLGYMMNVGPECEFFLFHTDKDGAPTLNTHDNAGYFDMGPIDLGNSARKDITIALTKMGFNVEASHHEVAPGQHEIDFEYADALNTADNIMTFKMVVRMIAQKHGLHATFMPKPKAKISGSGMHLNISLANEKGENIFFDKSGEKELSGIAYNFIAGMLSSAKGFSALTNPIVNSYKRLVPGYEAPIMIAWSHSNRSPLIRIPAKRGPATRVELRNPDPCANPYLSLAVILATGLNGIVKNMKPDEPVVGNLYKYTNEELALNNIERLPSTLYEAIKCFSKDEFVKNVLGEHTSEKIIETALYEWEEYSKYVTPWEVERYLKNR